MNFGASLRVIAGLALIAAGLWLFGQGLPGLQFQPLFFCTLAGVFIIEAPRFLNLFRQRAKRIETYVERTPSAEPTMRRALRAGRWGWICYIAAVVLVCAGALLLRATPDAASAPAITIIIVGVGAILLLAGFVLQGYNVYARIAVEFDATSAPHPEIKRKRLWMIAISCFAIIIAIVASERFWPIDALNWMYGAGTLFLLAAFVWRWSRGWPNDPP